MPQPDKLEYPSDIAISQAKDLIGRLLVKPALRLGSGPTGVDDLRHHQFLSVHSILSVMIASSFIPCWPAQTIDWDNLRHYSPPAVPDPLDLDSKPTNPVSACLFLVIRLFIIPHNTDSTGAFRRFSGKNFNSAETSYPSSVQRAAKTAQVFLLMSLSSMIPSPRYPSVLRLCARHAGGQSCQPKTPMPIPSLLICRPSSEHHRLTMHLFKPPSRMNQHP